MAMIMQRYPSYSSTTPSAENEKREEEEILPRPFFEPVGNASIGEPTAVIDEMDSPQQQETSMENLQTSSLQADDSLKYIPHHRLPSAAFAPLPEPIKQDGSLQIVDEVSAHSNGRLLNDRDLILDCLSPLLRKRSQDSTESTNQNTCESTSTSNKNKRPFVDPSMSNFTQRKSYKKTSDDEAESDRDLQGNVKTAQDTNNSSSHDTVPFEEEKYASSVASVNVLGRAASAAVDGGAATTAAEYSSAPAPLELTEYQTNLWESRFKELCHYRETHGNCFVPHNWSENLALAKWVKRQRYQYKLKQDGKHSTLTDERQKALENLGFIWDSHSAIWEERLGELIEFKKKLGHCNVPSTYKENHSLSVWVQCQRRHYKHFIEQGQQTTSSRPRMSKERVQRLESIGFVWKPRIGRKEDDTTNKVPAAARKRKQDPK